MATVTQLVNLTLLSPQVQQKPLVPSEEGGTAMIVSKADLRPFVVPCPWAKHPCIGELRLSELMESVEADAPLFAPN